MTLDERVVLIEGLVRAFDQSQSISRDSELRMQCKNILKTIKDFQAPRTNHFAVSDRFEGIAERAEIYNRSDLASAIRQDVARAQRLDNKFMPEYLSFLLHVSDDPIKKGEVQRLVRCEQEAPPLTWSDILHDEPFDNTDGLWDDVDFAAGSSIDEDEDRSLPSVTSASTSDSVSCCSTSMFDGISHGRDSAPTQTTLTDTINAQCRWEDLQNLAGENQFMSEQEVIRESLDMLRGYESRIFVLSDDKLDPRNCVMIQGVSHQVLRDILCQLASLGFRLRAIRQQTRKSCKVPVLQTLQSSISIEMQKLSKAFSTLDEYVSTHKRDPFTILNLLAEAHSLCKMLVPLAELLRVEQSGEASKLTLDALFSFACLQQSSGNAEAYHLSITVLEACFQAYLLPVNEWLLSGKAEEVGESFLISASEDTAATFNPQMSKIPGVMHDDKTTNVPECMSKFAGKMFETGKSLQILKSLGRVYEGPQTCHFKLYTSGRSKDLNMSPLRQIFESSFSSWIDPIQEGVISLLSTTLSSDCELIKHLDALHHVFLGQSGQALDFLADRLLNKITHKESELIDSSALTKLYHQAFSFSEYVFEEHINVTCRSVNSYLPFELGSFFQTLCVSYKLPWIMSNMIRSDTIGVYRRTHTIAVRLRIAKRSINTKFHQGKIRLGNIPDHFTSLGLSVSHRLRWFVHSMESYLFEIAIKDATQLLRTRLSEPGDFDTKIKAHDEFVATIERRYFLQPKSARTCDAMLSLFDLSAAIGAHLQHHWQTGYGIEFHPEASHLRTTLDLNERSLDRLKGYASTYEQLIVFIRSGILEHARASRDESLQILADSFMVLDQAKQMVR